MRLKSLSYTSLARPSLTADDVDAVHQTARHLNALDGITGLLVYNGRNFLQVIEGAESGIDDLYRRLLADPRHSAMNVEDERYIESREFPEWAMEFAHVDIGHPDARRDIIDLLPRSLPDKVRMKLAEVIAGDLPLPRA